MDSMTTAALIAAVIVVLASVLAVIALFAAHGVRARVAARRQRTRDRLRTAVLRICDAEQVDLAALTGRDRRALIGLVLDVLPRLRGVDYENVRQWLFQSGLLSGVDPDSWRPRDRSQAARMLAVSRRDWAVMQLLELMQDSDARVRADAARSLGRVGDPRVVRALIRSTTELNGVPRATAGLAVLRLLPEGYEGAFEALWSENEGERQLSAEILGHANLTDSFLDLMDRVQDASVSVRLAAIRSLGQLSTPVARDVLRRRRTLTRNDREAQELDLALSLLAPPTPGITA